MWVSLSCTLGYKCVTVMDGVKFEFDDIISLYKKNNSEWRLSSYDITKYIWCNQIDDMIANKVIYIL